MKNFIPDQIHPIDSDDSEDSIVAPENDLLELYQSSDENQDVSDISDDATDAEDNFSVSDEEEYNNMTDSDDSDVEDNLKQNNTKKRQREEDSDDEDCSDEEEMLVTMQDLFGNKPNQEANRTHPPNLKTECEVFDICFDPVKEVFAIGDICGQCILYRYSLESVDEIKRFTHHKDSCRQICFDEDGDTLYTIGSDMSLGIIDIANGGSLKAHRKDIHKSPISSFYEMSCNVYATGDDEGTVKIWDARIPNGVKSIDCSTVGKDAISSLLSSSKEDYLSATCMDGSISGINLRKFEIETQSEMYKTEFTSQSLLKCETKLVVGGDKEPGTFTIFNWGEFGYHTDSFKGLPGGITSQACVTENMVFVGCADSTIRAVNFFPHRFLGVVGQHSIDSSGIDSLAVSFDGDYLASSASDNIIQFWDISKLYKKRLTDKKKGNKKAAVRRNLPSSRERNTRDFFNDIPQKVESDDEGGPVASTSFQDIDSD